MAFGAANWYLMCCAKTETVIKLAVNQQKKYFIKVFIRSGKINAFKGLLPVLVNSSNRRYYQLFTQLLARFV
jgi:hypothetical protein